MAGEGVEHAGNPFETEKSIDSRLEAAERQAAYAARPFLSSAGSAQKRHCICAYSADRLYVFAQYCA
ncbi:hypothetical protein AOX55_00004148 [Sinorhizobium fredii CCBAU 25509]|nr:hypothetical protein AOX55_00004148 [Sinorhizobium fredii CCBAU 25509]